MAFISVSFNHSSPGTSYYDTRAKIDIVSRRPYNALECILHFHLNIY